MTLQQLLATNIKSKNVYILGYPASGKTKIATDLYHLNHTTHSIIHTDDYMCYGYEQALYSMINNMEHINSPFIIEGVNAYRMLRKVYELNIGYLKPDLIIDLQVPEWLQNEIYRTERPEKKITGVKALNLSLSNIYNEWYMTTPAKEMPLILEYLNDWKC